MEEHLCTLQHKANVRVLNRELVKDEDRHECVACKSSLGKFSIKIQFKTEKYLGNINGITEDLRINNTTTYYCTICITR